MNAGALAPELHGAPLSGRLHQREVMPRGHDLALSTYARAQLPAISTAVAYVSLSHASRFTHFRVSARIKSHSRRTSYWTISSCGHVDVRKVRAVAVYQLRDDKVDGRFSHSCGQATTSEALAHLVSNEEW